MIKLHHFLWFVLDIISIGGENEAKMAILSHFEPKNWSHIFLEADLAKILMDYVLLTLPASLANFFHGLIWKSLA